MRRIPFRLAWLAALAVGACSDPMGAGEQRVSVATQSGDDQFGLPQTSLAEPLQVIVTDPGSNRPLEGVLVTWRVVQGAGATLTPPAAETGSNGIASTMVRLGADTGRYVFEATAENLVGSAASFDARAVMAPGITALAPGQVNAGDTVTITGSNFSANAAENIVLFSGFRGLVVTASTTQLRVVVPLCLPSRTVSVVAMLGAVASNAVALTVNGGTGTTLQLNRGEVLLLVDARDLECQRVTPQAGSAFLIIPQNVSEVAHSETFFELIGLAAGAAVAARRLGVGGGAADFGSLWELRLRSLERHFQERAERGELSINAAVAAPEVGDRRTFKVFDQNEKFVNVTAEVEHISQRAIIYQDLKAPANGFTLADFQALGSSFDSPTYDTDVAVFGAPSDIDANGKVIILLTPIVNQLTPRGSNGFVAGFFFGCDLQTTSQCSGSNRGEMFYGFVPDPTGTFSDPRSRVFILRELLPVVAHELQHMISFGARQNLDALWLSEGLAHMAEDLVADAHEARGDATTAQQFRAQNYNRARLYLRDSTSHSLLADELPGSLQLRGAAWLMVKYLAAHYGGNTLLGRLSAGPLSSVQNVTAATGQTWRKLMSDWAVALWADDAPELAGVTLRPEHTFPDIDLRLKLNPLGGYELQPLRVPFDDFVVRGKLPASSQRHLLMESGANPKSVNLAFTGQRGGPFGAQAVTQVSILRVQ